MPCKTVQLPSGRVARVRLTGRRPKACSGCGGDSELLCDGKDPGATSTCDAPLCRRCALHAPKDKDYCPRHAHQARLQRSLPFAAERSKAP